MDYVHLSILTSTIGTASIVLIYIYLYVCIAIAIWDYGLLAG